MELPLVNTIAEKRREAYLVGFLVGLPILVYFLYVNNWNVGDLLTSQTLLGLVAIDMILMKFLSGIGIMLTYASFCGIILKLSSEGIKGSKNKALTLKVILLLPIMAIAAYGAVKILGVYSIPESLDLVETVIAIYGIWSLMLFVYIIPAVMSVFQPEYKESKIDSIKRRIGGAKFSLWKGYQTKIRKDHGKVYAKEVEQYEDRLSSIRSQLSGILLLPICIILLIVPPLAGLLIVLWLRLFSLQKVPLSKFERLLLVLVILLVLVASTYAFLFLDTVTILTSLNLSYGIGIIVSIILLAIVVITS